MLFPFLYTYIPHFSTCCASSCHLLPPLFDSLPCGNISSKGGEYVNNELTKDMDKLICTLYKNYLIRVKSGESKTNAAYFGNSDEITEKYLPDWHPEDTAQVCWDLYSDGYLICSRGDDIANTVTLTKDALYYMESRFKNGLKEVIDFITKFVP